MSLVAPQGRQPLSADALFRLVRSGCATIADHRATAGEIACTDALLSAFAMFSLKAPSLLAFDKQRAEGNLGTLYGIKRAPCDTQRRALLDPVPPESLRPVCKSVFRPLPRGKALAALVFLDDHSLLGLDGTGSCASKTIPCASCLQKVHSNGSVTSSHQMWGAALVHPDVRAVIPVVPEPIVQHDGTEKHDGERNAAKRFMAKLRQDHPHLKCLVTEDRLSSHAPHIETLQAHDRHYILGGKEGDHAFGFREVQTAEHAGRVTYDERHDRAARLRHRCRFVHDVPLNASNAAVRVHCIAYWDMGEHTLQHCSWVPDLRVTQRHVYRLMRGGRARWKIENETCNTRKNQGDNFAPTYGHGAQHLSVMLAMGMMRAFLVEQTPQRCGALFQAVWAKLGSKRLRWERLRALCYDYV